MQAEVAEGGCCRHRFPRRLPCRTRRHPGHRNCAAPTQRTLRSPRSAKMRGLAGQVGPRADAARRRVCLKCASTHRCQRCRRRLRRHWLGHCLRGRRQGWQTRGAFRGPGGTIRGGLVKTFFLISFLPSNRRQKNVTKAGRRFGKLKSGGLPFRAVLPQKFTATCLGEGWRAALRLRHGPIGPFPSGQTSKKSRTSFRLKI